MLLIEFTANLLIPAHAECKVFTGHTLPNQDAKRVTKKFGRVRC